MAFLVVDARGRNTLPTEVRRSLGIADEGTTLVLLERTERGTWELIPVSLVPRDQLWYHHPDMARRVAEGEADFASGRVLDASSPEALDALLQRMKGSGAGEGESDEVDSAPQD